MLNKIFTDNDFNIELLAWLQEPRTYDSSWENTIVAVIDADDSNDQYLYVDSGLIGSNSYTITPNQINEIEIETLYWNMGDDTTITLYKGLDEYNTITITFPDEIDSLGMINQDENNPNAFVMTGSYNDPSDLAESVERLEEEKQDTLTAGSGIEISGNVISASGGGGVNYTLSEQDTGLTFESPQTQTPMPVYQQTYIVGCSYPSGSLYSQEIPITSDIRDLVSIEIILANKTLKRFYSFNGTNAGGADYLVGFTWYLDATNHKIIIERNKYSDRPQQTNGFYWNITLRYTKPTS